MSSPVSCVFLAITEALKKIYRSCGKSQKTRQDLLTQEKSDIK